ncbi:hypothetical protein [Candidatus Poriferisodalis sp.]|uniref:hypothetical protein n=1 Tax=Candidatus Poriferisodalis sp. TaxID=3101277 RepID=UPI003AF9A535
MSTPLTVIVRAAAALLAVLVVAGCAPSDPARAVAADELTAPPEWAEQARGELRTDFLCTGTGCTSYRVEWSAQDPPEAEDLRSAATGAGWDRIDIDEPCPPPPPDTEPGPYCTLTATSGDVALTLWTSYVPRKDPPWRITLLAE